MRARPTDHAEVRIGAGAAPIAGRRTSLSCVSPSAERRAAWEAVLAYHEAQLALLLERVGVEIDRFRSGELDAFEADQVLFHYSRAAKELWKFCNGVDVEWVARDIRERAPDPWWERGAPRQH